MIRYFPFSFFGVFRFHGLTLVIGFLGHHVVEFYCDFGNFRVFWRYLIRHFPFHGHVIFVVFLNMVFVRFIGNVARHRNDVSVARHRTVGELRHEHWHRDAFCTFFALDRIKFAGTMSTVGDALFANEPLFGVFRPIDVAHRATLCQSLWLIMTLSVSVRFFIRGHLFVSRQLHEYFEFDFYFYGKDFED